MAGRVKPGAPAPWSLGGPAPEPVQLPEVDDKPAIVGAATHTGTDPYGRAIGPKEDHTKGKRDADGKTARGPSGAAARPDNVGESAEDLAALEAEMLAKVAADADTTTTTKE